MSVVKLLCGKGADLNTKDWVSLTQSKLIISDLSSALTLCVSFVVILIIFSCVCQEGHDALYKAERKLRNGGKRRVGAEEIIAVLQEEAEWRRVKNFVELLHTGQPI